MVTPRGLQTSPNLMKAVVNFPIQSTVHNVRQFLGLTSYRRFIMNFSSIAEPLHKLTRKDIVFDWSEECQYAFDILKTKITEAPVLIYPDFSKPFLVETDASIRGLGAIVSQEYDDATVHPVAFASRALSPAEKIIA
jgi:hypothetical protein